MAASNADNKPYNVFLSWSGERSGAAAKAMWGWLPCMVQAAVPWLSSRDIGLGTQYISQIQSALKQIRIGIFFVTSDNAVSPWMLYEAGAISKNVEDDSRVFTYLLDSKQPITVEGPLGHFQSTTSDKEGTWRLLEAVNAAIEGGPEGETLRRAFEMGWETLKNELDSIPKTGGTVKKPTTDQMLETLLETTRVIQGQLTAMHTKNILDKALYDAKQLVDSQAGLRTRPIDVLSGLMNQERHSLPRLDVFGRHIDHETGLPYQAEPPVPPISPK
ncbi:MAG: hypothetical protein J0H49_10700 [Acidobacteria bacterium]|nr:hypothetical protein [Acidobacteriota bacterium]